MGQYFRNNAENSKSKNKEASDMAYLLQELRIASSMIVVLLGVGLGNQQLSAVATGFLLGGVIDLAGTRAVNRAALKRLKGSG